MTAHGRIMEAIFASLGVLREVKTVEDGKRVSRFYGDARKWMEPFESQTRTFITKFNTASAPTRKARKD